MTASSSSPLKQTLFVTLTAEHSDGGLNSHQQVKLSLTLSSCLSSENKLLPTHQ